MKYVGEDREEEYVLPVVTTELPQHYHSLRKDEDAKVINLYILKLQPFGASC